MFILCIFIGVSIVTLLINILLVHKPRKEEIKKLMGCELYHYTNDKNIEKIDLKNGEVELITSKRYIANIYNWYKPSIFFFIKNAEDEEIKKIKKFINIDDKEKLKNRVIINASNLDFNNVKIRNYDKTLIYSKDYKGPGTIERNIRNS